MSDFYKRVLSLQNELKAPKGQYNSLGKYKYRSCEDILEAVKPLTAKYGVLLTVSDDFVVLGGRYYCKATATLRNAENGEESISNTAFAREAESKKGMDESQVTGTASSYARKYALNGLFCIDDTKDADTDAYTQQTALNTGRSTTTEYKSPADCSDCGKSIMSTKKNDGTVMSTTEIIAYSRKKFGRSLCPDCMKKLNEQG